MLPLFLFLHLQLQFRKYSGFQLDIHVLLYVKISLCHWIKCVDIKLNTRQFYSLEF